MPFSSLYKQAEDVPIILSIDFGFLNEKKGSAKFKTPEDIFKYSTALEEKIVKEYEKKYPPAPARASFDSVLKPVPANGSKASPPPQSKSPPKEVLENFDQIPPQSPWDVNTSVTDDIQALDEALEGMAISSVNRSEFDAETREGASTFLPDASDSEKRSFMQALKDGRDKGIFAEDLGRAFHLFKGEPGSIPLYAENLIRLRSFGFKDSHIDIALLDSKNDWEKALEYILKNKDFLDTIE